MDREHTCFYIEDLPTPNCWCPVTACNYVNHVFWICQMDLEESRSEITGLSFGTSSELLIPEHSSEDQSLGICSWSLVSSFTDAPSESINERNDFCVWSCRLPSSFPLQTIIFSLSNETRTQGTRSYNKIRGWEVYSVINHLQFTFAISIYTHTLTLSLTPIFL
jgi:hypothetical protein